MTWPIPAAPTENVYSGTPNTPSSLVNEDPLTPQLTPSHQRRHSADSDSRQRHYVNVSPGENPAATSSSQPLPDQLAPRVGGGYISNGLPLANRRTNVPSELRLPGQHPSPLSTINNNQSSSAGLVTITYDFLICFTYVGPLACPWSVSSKETPQHRVRK